MKKIIVVVAALSLVSVNMFADYKSEEHFTITKGDVSWIKENAYARVSVDLSNAQIVHFNDKGEVEESLGLYKDYYEGGEENMHKDENVIANFCSTSYKGAFCKSLNFLTKKSGMKIVVSEETEKLANSSGKKDAKVQGMKCRYPDSPVKYIIVVKVETIDVGNFNPMYNYNHRAGSAWMCGKMSVIDVATGESIFEADIEKARSYGAATNFVWRFGDLISCELLVNDIYKPAYGKK